MKVKIVGLNLPEIMHTVYDAIESRLATEEELLELAEVCHNDVQFIWTVHNFYRNNNIGKRNNGFGPASEYEKITDVAVGAAATGKRVPEVDKLIHIYSNWKGKPC